MKIGAALRIMNGDVTILSADKGAFGVVCWTDVSQLRTFDSASMKKETIFIGEIFVTYANYIYLINFQRWL